MANWEELGNSLAKSPNDIKFFASESDGEKLITSLGIGENTVIGQVILNAAMITVNGCLRLHGSGDGKAHRDILEYNIKLRKTFGGNKLIVADDVWGGLFAISCGDFQGSPRNIWYLAPDTLSWEDLGITYSQFFAWALDERVERFYEPFLWDSVRPLLPNLRFDEGIVVYPPLWSTECDPDTASVKVAPFDDLIS